MTREPIVPQAERAVLWRAAEVLERQASEVAARLVDRLEGTLYRESKDLTSAELRDQALELVRGVAEALRRGEPEAGGAPWTGAARAHAGLRQRQRVPLRDLVREYQMLREELWQALRQHLAAVVPGDVYDLAENLDNALATMVTIATDTYAAEERVFAGLRTANQRLARTYRRLQEASTAVEQGRRTLRTVIDTIPAGVTVTDERGTITLNNPAAESMLGYVEGATAYGWRAGYTLFRADGSPFAHEELPLRRAIERGETSSGVEIYVRRQGIPESVILAGGAPVRDDAGRIVGAVVVFQDITARKRAEEALSRSEAMYRRMVETAQEGVVLVDAEGTITYLNERMAEQLGCASDEMRGRPLMSFVDEESRSAVADLFQKLRRGERDVRDAKFLYPGRGGLWTLVASTPFFEDGRYAGALVMTSDLTEHLRAEEAGGRLAAIVESSEDAIVGVELEGTISTWNPAAERLFGYSAQEAVGQPVSIIIPPDRLEEIPQILGKIGRGEHLRDYETVRMRKDGTLVEVSLSLAPILDRAGRIVGGAAIIDDISERKRAERERERLLEEVSLRAAELDTTLASIPAGLVIVNLAGEIIRLNDGARRLLGYSPEEGRGLLWERVTGLRAETAEGQPVRPEQLPVSRALRGQTVHGVILVFHPTPEQAVWNSIDAAPIRAPDGRLLGATITYTDVTRLRELQEWREDLLRAVSHDLRNPLTAVQGQAQLLLRMLERAGHDGRERSSAEAILTGARRMNTMIQDLVDATRLEAGRLRLSPQPLDLPSFTEDLLRREVGVLETGRVRVEATAGLPLVSADPDRLERVLVNLLSNALSYSAPGSEVTVSLSRRDGQVVTSVIDRGPGIPPEELPRLFQRFYRPAGARARPGGLGLGLYITRLLVEAQGGRIWAESELGKGSNFHFSLPEAGAEGQHASAGRPGRRAAGSDGRRTDA